jgi:hypothetical protein
LGAAAPEQRPKRRRPIKLRAAAPLVTQCRAIRERMSRLREGTRCAACGAGLDCPAVQAVETTVASRA